MPSAMNRKPQTAEPDLEPHLQTILNRSKFVARSLGHVKAVVLKAPKTFASFLIAGLAALASIAVVLGAWEALTSGVVQLLLGYPQLVAGALVTLLSVTPLAAALKPAAGNTTKSSRMMNGVFGLILMAGGLWVLML